jgi:acyl-CoA hydrolase
VDRIRQSRKISASDDLILTGQVVWVGNSSLDVLMEIHCLKDIKVNPVDIDDGGAVMIKENVPSRLLSSLFTYVARDRQTGKSCAVNRFIPSGKDEEELCARRNALALSRKSAKKVVIKNGGNGLGEGVDSQVITI